MFHLLKLLTPLLILSSIFTEGPLNSNLALDSYSDIFNRGVKTPGFWGAVPGQSSNVFNEDFNANGFQQIYNLNSQSPLAGSRGTGFDTTTTMFNQYGPTSFEVLPVQSNFMPQSRINAYTYDLNEPRMAAIYKNYMRFMNKNLDRLSNVVKGNTEFSDLNNNEFRKLKYPHSFQYKTKYFDGMDRVHTIPGYYHQKLIPISQQYHIPVESRQLSLKEEAVVNNVDRIQGLKKALHHIESKLNDLENLEIANQNNEGRFLKL